jgi:CHAD domain-containing protein
LLRKHRRKRVYRTIGTVVRRQTARLSRQSNGWIGARFRLLRQQQADTLRDQLNAAIANPRRRILHMLRLQIKALRYQEELAQLYPFGNPGILDRLKAAQTVLGEYEERAEFRKLARSLGLDCQKRLRKDWRRARKQARRVPSELLDIPAMLTDERLRFLYPRPSPSQETHLLQGA